MNKKYYTKEDVEELKVSIEGKQRNFVDLTGHRYHRLTVLAYAGGRDWFCECDCGNITKPASHRFKRGKTKSCGCYNEENLGKSSKIPVEQLIKEICDHHPYYEVIDHKDGLVMTAWSIKCNTCGDTFESSPSNLRLGKRGCSCVPNKKKSRETFIQLAEDKANKLGIVLNGFRGENFDSHTKLQLYCPTCDYSWERGHSGFVNYSQGCPHCLGKHNYDSESFIKRATKAHKGRYRYDLFEYNGGRVKSKIICDVHGVFEQIPEDHIAGHGCPKCGGTEKLSLEGFIGSAYSVHGDTYDYSKVVYKSLHKPVIIICRKHGEFSQSPASHIHQGSGCPECGSSGGFCQTTSGYLYIFEITSNSDSYLKVGITNKNPEVRRRRQESLGKYSISILGTWFSEDGSKILSTETSIKRRVPCGVVPKEDYPDGFTETCDVCHLGTILQIIDEHL